MALRERTHRAVRPHRSKDPYNPKKSKGKSYNGSAEEYLGLNKNKNYNKNIDPLDEKIKAKKKLLRELVNAQRVRYRNRKKKGKNPANKDIQDSKIEELLQEIKILHKKQRNPETVAILNKKSIKQKGITSKVISRTHIPSERVNQREKAAKKKA